jgi:ABC-type uncharacterized transport system substrate-binding protein
MRRRDFMTHVGSVAACAVFAPLAAQAQALPVVGFLNPTSSRLYAFNAEAFRQGLQDVGFVEGKNVHIEYHWGEFDYSRLPALAAELVARQVAVIAATGDVGSAKAAQAAAFETFMREQADALFVATDPMLLSERSAIADFAMRQRIPAIHFDRQYPLGGGLISYGTSIAGMYRQAGVYSGQILKGANPAEMPVIQPTKFELVINLKIAAALGLTVPDKLLAITDEVVE